jgi:hypothetical protein
MSKYGKTLVLDSSYIPRSVISSSRAFVISLNGNCEIIHSHPESFQLVNKELIIKKPSIIRIPKYINIQFHNVPLSKANIYRRDGYKCVYCGHNKKQDLTIDHVIPKCKGGKNTWENMVSACKRCNNNKDSQSLEEFGVKIEKPKKPHYLMLLKNLSFIHEEWEDYLLIGKSQI